MIGSIVLSILASICYTVSVYGSGMPDWMRSLATLLTIIFGGFALVPMIERGLDFMADWYKNIRKAAAITQISLLMDSAKGMNQSQIDMVLRSPLYLRKRLYPSNLGVMGEFLFGDTWISQEFIRGFFDASDENSLCPVGYYSDGEDRRKVNILVDWMVGFGLAMRQPGEDRIDKPGSNPRRTGPNRVVWVEPYAEVRKYFGV